jgi:hypothetical protein
VAIQYQSSSRHSQLPPTLSPYSELYAMPNESPIQLKPTIQSAAIDMHS